MSRILVTGGTGFIGQALLRALAADGHALRATVRRSPPDSFLAGVEVTGDLDLERPVDWRPLLAGIERVIHLAGIAHTGSGVGAERYDRINRLATARLATAAAYAGVEQFVFVSSVRAQSGPSADHVLTERDVPTPTDDYGRSKLAAERAVQAAGVPFTILRPVLVYGPGVKGNMAALMRAAASPWPLPLRNFHNRRSLLGIDNFVSAIRFVLSAPVAIGETYLVADPGEAPRLCDVIATLRTARGRRALLLPLPPPLLRAALRAVRCDALWDRVGGNLEADSGKLLAAGWRPKHDMLAGLAQATLFSNAAAVRER